MLRLFLPPDSPAPRKEVSAAAAPLANPILRGHVSLTPHPLMHEELCQSPELASATLCALQRQHAMFLTYVLVLIDTTHASPTGLRCSDFLIEWSPMRALECVCV